MSVTNGLLKGSVRLLGISALLASVSACTFVKLSDAGSNVDIRQNTSVANCQRLGVISVSGVDGVGFVKRGDTKVAGELSAQARNDAASMGANVVVPLGDPVEGQQKFEAYKCP